MPMNGRSNSQSVKPSALSKERWGALSGPLVIKSLRLLIVLFLIQVLFVDWFEQLFHVHPYGDKLLGQHNLFGLLPGGRINSAKFKIR